MNRLEGQYNEYELDKSKLAERLVEGLEKSKSHFESRLDYSRGRLMNWETNEKRKLSQKQEQAQAKVKTLEALEKEMEEEK